MSALLPLVLYASIALGLAMVFRGGAQHRAVVWVSGPPAVLTGLGQAVKAHRVFALGSLAAAGEHGPPPAGCRAERVAISFARLHDYELAPAHEALAALARAHGAQACPQPSFRFHEMPSLEDAAAAGDALALAAWLAFVPMAAVFGTFWAFLDRLRLRASVSAMAWRLPLLATGLIAGTLLALLGRGLAAVGVVPPGPLADAGPAATSLLLLAYPLLQESAFRAWALPLAERALGAGAALAATFLLQWLLLPAPPVVALAMAVQGTALGLVFLRTRSLPACVLAQSLACAGALTWP